MTVEILQISTRMVSLFYRHRTMAIISPERLKQTAGRVIYYYPLVIFEIKLSFVSNQEYF